jgi:predicted TIM-barrel fold metal-dependent hydrolase
MPIFDSYTWLGGACVPGVASNPVTIAHTLRDRGVSGAVLSSAHAAHLDPVAGNRILKSTIEKERHLYGCLVTHTNRVELSINVMRELMSSHKFVGMMITSSDPEEPLHRVLTDELINAYRRYTRPLFIQTPTSAHISVALSIAKDFPMLKVICLGMGGRDWRTAIAAAHTATNIILETSGVLDRAKLPAAVEVLGHHRIIFGSGSPHLDCAAAIGLMEDCGLSTSVKNAIYYQNARKLFDLPEHE